ncbi:MAG: Lrp/AsnC family transcriptional regulator, partial [Pseudomonadota bacterium]
QADGRASFQEIGDRIGLSMSACHKRTKALEQSGVIERYVAVVSERRAGFSTHAYVEVTLKDQTQKTLEAFERAVARHEQVMECVLISGESDYLLRILCDGVEGYEELHKEFLTTLPGVERLHSKFALRTVCRRHAIPVRA